MPTLTRRRFLGQSAALTTLAATSTAGTGWAHPASSDVLEKLPAIDAPGDLAAAMVDGMHKFLDAELSAAPRRRKAFWKPDTSSADRLRVSARQGE